MTARGIDSGKVKAKAVESEIISPEDAESMTSQEAF